MATTHIVWNWGSNTNIDFHADTDILEFGWFQADQFTVSEVNGTVVIAIPSNHQTYTLQHTTLHDLHLSNIVANDASTIGEWTSVLGGAPVTPPAPPPPPVTPAPPPPVVSPGDASPWSASAIYTTGMTVTENGITYKANWWTQGNDPAQHNAAFGEPWTAVGGATSHDPTSHDSTAWSEASVYTAGMTAIEDGVIYQAIRGSGQYASREVGAELSYPGKSASPWLSREASGKPVGPP